MPSAHEVIEAIKNGEAGRVADMLDADLSLLAARADNGVSAILLAMYHGRREIADVFVARGAELDIFEAAATGGVERLRIVVTPENVNSDSPDGFQPLGLACFFGQAEAARLLIERGADVNLPAHNAMKVQPIHAATAGRSAAIVRLLLEHGADPNARQQQDFTPMDAARQNNDEEIIQLLRAHGASA